MDLFATFAFVYVYVHLLYNMNKKELRLQAEKNRKRLLEVAFLAQAAHLGGGLSCLNILTALYFKILSIDPSNPKDPARDRFIMSKGHSVESLYVTLESRGFFSPELTDTLGKFGSILAGHPTVDVPGIEVNTGSLGHGLSVGVEIALAANHYKLDNLVAIIDRNGLQISGSTEEVMALESINQRWTAYGMGCV
jgi:transketolase